MASSTSAPAPALPTGQHVSLVLPHVGGLPATVDVGRMGRRGVVGMVLAAVAGGVLLAGCGDEPKAQSADGGVSAGLAPPGAFTTDGTPRF